MKLWKVISGAQTGADQAGLAAALDAGFHTGGYVTRGCRTLEGDRPDLIKLYNLFEMTDRGYPRRTRQNVITATATMRFARVWTSPGERLTQRYLHDEKKYYFDVTPLKPKPVIDAVDWLEKHEVTILNVAGNAESTAPGIYSFTYDYLTQVFRELKKRG